MNKKLAVIGHPIGHSLSPVMHNASIRARGWESLYEYGKLDIPPDQLMDRLRQLPEEGFLGVNLTIPHKEIAFKNLDPKCLDGSAALLGAVNTVHFSDGKMWGYNTDGIGFLKAVEEAFGSSVEGKSIFVLGCGGAGRAVALTAARNGAKEFTLSDVDAQRIHDLSGEMPDTVSVKNHGPLDPAEQVALCRAADLVIQASPVGMKKDDPSLLPPDAFRKGQCVFDLIYMYPETAILTVAKSQGAQIANGLGMLLHQGAKAFEIWTDRTPDTDAMRSALEEVVYS